MTLAVSIAALQVAGWYLYCCCALDNIHACYTNYVTCARSMEKAVELYIKFCMLLCLDIKGGPITVFGNFFCASRDLAVKFVKYDDAIKFLPYPDKGVGLFLYSCVEIKEIHDCKVWLNYWLHKLEEIWLISTFGKFWDRDEVGIL